MIATFKELIDKILVKKSTPHSIVGNSRNDLNFIYSVIEDLLNLAKPFFDNLKESPYHNLNTSILTNNQLLHTAQEIVQNYGDQPNFEKLFGKDFNINAKLDDISSFQMTDLAAKKFHPTPSSHFEKTLEGLCAHAPNSECVSSKNTKPGLTRYALLDTLCRIYKCTDNHLERFITQQVMTTEMKKKVKINKNGQRFAPRKYTQTYLDNFIESHPLPTSAEKKGKSITFAARKTFTKENLNVTYDGLISTLKEDTKSLTWIAEKEWRVTETPLMRTLKSMFTENIAGFDYKTNKMLIKDIKGFVQDVSFNSETFFKTININGKDPIALEKIDLSDRRACEFPPAKEIVAIYKSIKERCATVADQYPPQKDSDYFYALCRILNVDKGAMNLHLKNEFQISIEQFKQNPDIIAPQPGSKLQQRIAETQKLKIELRQQHSAQRNDNPSTDASNPNALTHLTIFNNKKKRDSSWMKKGGNQDKANKAMKLSDDPSPPPSPANI